MEELAKYIFGPYTMFGWSEKERKKNVKRVKKNGWESRSFPMFG